MNSIFILKKMTGVPLLGEYIVGVWNLFFAREFHMTDDSGLFKTKPDKGDLTLYEGRMIWHFEHSIGTLMKESGHCLTKPIIATGAVLAPPTLTDRVIYPWWLKSLAH